MTHLSEIYGTSLALLTDLYQLTMAYGYWKVGHHQQHAVFHHFFRRHPFQGGFTLTAGLQQALEFLEDFRFSNEDLDYLAGLPGNDGEPIFESDFLEYLSDLRLTVDIDAVPEGTIVFPKEPLVRVRGPLLQCQLLETPLLNLINFPTLIATKAARVFRAAEGDGVLEFGLRRAQGVDGGLTASRAAYIGGCTATSNVLTGKLFGIPVKGTHAHSWVMSFPSEIEAFEKYAEAMPNNGIFLVDTYDSLEGTRRACRIAEKLRAQGHEMIGIRLDSGDLAYLSIQSRRILDEAGFPDAKILASGDLDEYVIQSLKQQGAKIDLWGVGTKLATAAEDPSLGGVYKLAAMRDENGNWEPRLKLSEEFGKITVPGMLQVRRFYNEEGAVGDMIFSEHRSKTPEPTIIDPVHPIRQTRLTSDLEAEDLLVPVVRRGEVCYRSPEIAQVRQHGQDQLSRFHPGILRFENPHRYPVGLEKSLHELRDRMIQQMRGTGEI